MTQSNLIRLTGLWTRRDGEGTRYLSGSVSPSSSLVVLPNRRKRREEEPDFIAYLAPPERGGSPEEPAPKSPQEITLELFGPPALSPDAKRRANENGAK